MYSSKQKKLCLHSPRNGYDICSSFHEQTIFFPQVAEQTIYLFIFYYLLNNCFSQKKHSPPPQESNGWPLSDCLLIGFIDFSLN